MLARQNNRRKRVLKYFLASTAEPELAPDKLRHAPPMGSVGKGAVLMDTSKHPYSWSTSRTAPWFGVIQHIWCLKAIEPHWRTVGLLSLSRTVFNCRLMVGRPVNVCVWWSSGSIGVRVLLDIYVWTSHPRPCMWNLKENSNQWTPKLPGYET
jgi:hypothetical protein